MKKTGLLFLIAVFLLSVIPVSGQSTDISDEDLKEITHFLASDKLKGRKTGTPGEARAAKYIQDVFQKAGLKLLGEDGYQYFDVVTGAESGPATSLTLGEEELQYGEDFVVLSFSSSGFAEGEVVFAGYGFGIHNDSITWNDFADLELDGKWALILRGEPMIDSANSPYTEFAGERHKVLLAKDHGAVGVIFVNGPGLDKEDELMDMHYDKSAALAGIPVFHISREIADKMLSNGDHTIEALENRLNEGLKPMSFPLGAELQGEAEVNQTTVRASNVVAMLEGNDPTLKGEYVIAGAHFDHLGMGGPGSGSREPDTTVIHNGADDNASGVAGIMELASYFAAERSNKRSLVFIAFSGEEMGLLGSKYFVEHPLVNLSKVQAMINFDMIGRLKEDKKVMVAGTGTSTVSEEILDDLGKRRKFDLAYSPEGFGASDHAAFYTKNIPVFFISTGAHSDYHTSRDDAELLDYKSQEEIVEFTADLVEELSNRVDRLAFQQAGPKARSGHGRGYKVVLGIMPDFTGSGSDGLRVDAVRPEGPAGLAGMKKGDVITALNGKSVGNIYDYMARLKNLEKGMAIPVDVLRNGKQKVLIVQL